MIQILNGVSENDNWLTLYKQGLNDVDIAKLLNLKSPETIRQRRLKENLPSNFSYNQRKIKKIDVQKYVDLGKTDSEIAKILNCSKDGVYSTRIRENITRRNYNESVPITLTEKQKEFIVGCVLGDGNISKINKNAVFVCEHGLKQEEYLKHKLDICNSLKPYYKHNIRNTPDKRNGNIYQSHLIRLNANSELNWFYNEFYNTGKKEITENLLRYYTPFAIAIHYMDDGFKNEYTYNICTNNFSIDSIYLLQKKLLEYDIETVVRKTKTLYIKSISKNNFTNLIKPYIIESMKYKIHNDCVS